MGKQTATGSWIVAIIVVAALVAAGVYLARKAMQAAAPSPAAPAASASASSPRRRPRRSAIRSDRPCRPRPRRLARALDDSDASVAAALIALAGGSDLSSLLVGRQLVTHIVTTVDALPRHDGLGQFTLPVQPPKGAFAVDQAGGASVLGAANAARHAPYMRVVDAVDPQALVAWYVHAYPLFQQAYRQLGYPRGYFNDRLIVAIDDMLAAPEPAEPPALRRSDVYYVYADPALESLSTGQKLLLRSGPADEARIKARLRAIRDLLIGQALPGTSTH
ncbi:DUF3014 domain-containing protein [Rhodanobacter sp. FW106-PBR-LB-2-11]|uniref:DUF3014 domain-containing protein n=1 Tax=Rhodanobacter sp. FW106-PBR-LB-2-11 TaxID=1524463 RepID=UPI0034E416CB